MSSRLRLLLALGLAARLLALNIDFAFDNDVLTFQIWAVRLWEDGFGTFFAADFFSDYPPAYLYVLYLVGMVRGLFGWDYLSPMFNFVTFLPAMLADVAIGWMVYAQFKKRTGDENRSLFAAGMWLFNPAIILISSVWGQVESAYALVLFASLVFMRDRKLVYSYILFGLAIMTKPQSLFLAPVYLFSAISYVMRDGDKKEAVKYTAISVANGLLAMVAVSLPFGLADTFGQLAHGVGLYAHASVNAFNIWTLFGQNWAPLDGRLLGVSFSAWGVLIAAAIIAGTFFALRANEKKHGGRYFYLIVAALFFTIFTFSVRMHERYMFPGLLFALLYLAESPERRRRAGGALYWLFSLTFFINCVLVLMWLRRMFDMRGDSFWLVAAPLANVLMAGAAVYMVFSNLKAAPVREKSPPRQKPARKTAAPQAELLAPPKMSRKDAGFLLALVFAYSVAAFVNLGDTAGPRTSWVPAENERAVADLGGSRHVAEIMYMAGAAHRIPFSVQYSEDGTDWSLAATVTPNHSDVFAWRAEPLDVSARYVMLVSAHAGLRLAEAAFRGPGGELLPVASFSEGAAALFDEQHLVPERPGFMNSMYFDEIYHARAGYEFAGGLNVWEDTHPPLGKLFKAASIRIFGMSPFAYRLPGTLFGILMLPLMYAFARHLFKSNNLGFFAAFLLSFDFMLFAQSRMATIDTYVTFFILAMYYLMYRYTSGVGRDSLRRQFMWLALCGAAMGLAVASKWQGVYAAIGLPLLFFPALMRLRARDRRAAGLTFLACFGFFVALPLAIYAASYIPFVMQRGGGLVTIWQNQQWMLRYHSNDVLGNTHAFSSEWWSWPLVIRPLWQYVSRLPDGMVSTMSSIGSPLVWWGGIAATLFALFKALGGRLAGRPCAGEREAAVLLVAFFAQIVPWMPVERLTFIYHYFPVLPFTVLLLVWSFRHHANDRRLMLGYGAAALVLFVLFYPVISGMPVSEEYARWLQWLPRWSFA